MSKQAIDAKRGTIFLVEPELLTIISDPTHPLYDSRVTLPLSEDMVASILAKGVIEPVIARKNGEAIEVTDGRQRTRCAVEANKRLKAEGAPCIQVPVILRRETDAEAFDTSVMLNEIRRGDDVMTKAEKADKLTKLGRSDAQIAVAFGVSIVTVRNWLKLLDLGPVVQKAVKENQIGAIEAVKELSGLKREEQKEKLGVLLATRGVQKTGRRHSDAEPGVASEDTKRKGEAPETRVESPIKRLRSLARSQDAMNALTAREEALFGWIFGAMTEGDLLTKIPRLEKFFKGSKSSDRGLEDKASDIVSFINGSIEPGSVLKVALHHSDPTDSSLTENEVSYTEYAPLSFPSSSENE